MLQATLTFSLLANQALAERWGRGASTVHRWVTIWIAERYARRVKVGAEVLVCVPKVRLV